MTARTSPASTPAASEERTGARRRYPVRDSVTMLRRNLKHMRRYPSMTLMLVGQPIVFLLLFVYVFGGALGRGLPGSPGGRRQYLTYVTPRSSSWRWRASRSEPRRRSRST